MPYEQAMEEGLKFAAKRMKEAEKQLAVNDREGAKSLLVDAYGVVSRLSPTFETTAEFASYYRDLGRGFAFVGDQPLSDKCLSLARVLQPEGPPEGDRATGQVPPTANRESAPPQPSALAAATSDALRAEIEAVRMERTKVEGERKEIERREQAQRSRDEVLVDREKRLADETQRLESVRRELEDRRRELEMKEMELAEARRRLKEASPPAPGA